MPEDGSPQPALYTTLADWYHLLTSPQEAEEEAAFFLRVFTEALGQRPNSLLDLGVGGGNIASHWKQLIDEMVLTDLAAEMLRQSQRLNPESEHVQGDMRTLRLGGRLFDAIFVHDAVVYLTTEADLRQAMDTAFLHLRPGGVAIFAPDHVRENFADGTECGGHDEAERGLRFLMWTHDPDPADNTYVVDFAYVLRRTGEPTRCIHDEHLEGLFSRDSWLRLLRDAGFSNVLVRPLEHSEVPPGSAELFVATR